MTLFLFLSPRVMFPLSVMFAWIAGVDGRAAGNFVPTGSMALPRAFHQATLLRNGMVLITAMGTPNAELYDPDAGKFIPTGNMAVGRRSHSATLLPDGRVLIVGGADDKNQIVSSAEIYDPLSGVFAPASQALTQTSGHSATLLKNGKVLIASGSNGQSYTVSPAQLFDSATGRFTLTGDYAYHETRNGYRDSGLAAAAATLLPNGKVLIAAEPVAEIYDPETGTFALAGRMATLAFGSESPAYIAGRPATLLTNGNVLLTGGEHEDLGRFAEAETYDWVTGAFAVTGKMSIPRDSHSATLLRDGTVLVAGGEFAQTVSAGQFFGGVSASTDLYDPVTGKFSAGPVMMSQRSAHTATQLADGRVLLTGGYTSFSPLGITGSAELFVPEGWAAALASPIVINENPASQTVAPGSRLSLAVLADGSGTIHYQWRRDGVAIAGATDPSLLLNAVTAASAGNYDVVLSNASGAVASRLARVIVDIPRPGRLVNMSVRAVVRDASSPLIVGATVAGGSKRVLVRALGPALASFGVKALLSDPRLDVHASVNGRDTIVAQNGDWAAAGGAAALRTMFTAVGAFDLPDVASRDAALVTTIDNACSVHVSDSAAGNGVVFVELYDADANAPARLVNLAARGAVGGADGSLIAGFVIDGNVPRRLLIRGIGPHLATTFGVSGAVTDPKLELYLSEGGRSTLFAANDNWAETGAASMRAAFVTAGAFDLSDPSSRDAALLVTVPAGVYTVFVSGAGNATGEALIDIYELAPAP